MAQHPEATALSDTAARQLANATKTTAQLSTISPRWLVHLLQWLPGTLPSERRAAPARWCLMRRTAGGADGAGVPHVSPARWQG